MLAVGDLSVCILVDMPGCCFFKCLSETEVKVNLITTSDSYEKQSRYSGRVVGRLEWAGMPQRGVADEVCGGDAEPGGTLGWEELRYQKNLICECLNVLHLLIAQKGATQAS